VSVGAPCMIVVWGLFCRIFGKMVPKQRSLVVPARGVRAASAVRVWAIWPGAGSGRAMGCPGHHQVHVLLPLVTLSDYRGVAGWEPCISERGPVRPTPAGGGPLSKIAESGQGSLDCKIVMSWLGDHGTEPCRREESVEPTTEGADDGCR
jgi:hypothetical protein